MSANGWDDDEVRCEINVTPLVDVMLVLLVIFMVVTPLLRLELPVDLPRAASAVESEARAEQLTLAVAADESVRLNGEPVIRDSLEAVLRDTYAARTDKNIFLEADRSLSYAAVVGLMDLCRKAGVERIGVLTQRAVEDPPG
jgi:biopolymer transport protein ExbD